MPSIPSLTIDLRFDLASRLLRRALLAALRLAKGRFTFGGVTAASSSLSVYNPNACVD